MNRLLSQFLRYGVVGAIATLVHYLFLVVCVEYASWPAWLASGCGAVVGAQVAYLGNRWFTFAYRGAALVAWSRFQATALLGALFGMAVVALGVRVGLHYLLAQGVATLVALLLTFVVNRRWTFRGSGRL